MSKIRSNRSMSCLLMEKEKQELKNFKNPKACFNYSQTTDDVYENLEDYNPTKKRRNVNIV